MQQLERLIQRSFLGLAFNRLFEHHRRRLSHTETVLLLEVVMNDFRTANISIADSIDGVVSGHFAHVVGVQDIGEISV